MTDSILRSYQLYTHTSIVPFPFAEAPPPAASDWLSGETQGFAFDATTYDEVTAEAYDGGPVGGTVEIIDTGTPANNLSDVALDLSNLVNSSTNPKIVHWTESPYVRWTPHNFCLQSQTLTNASWSTASVSNSSNTTTAPDLTNTADTITATAGNAIHYQRITNTISTANRRLYTASIWLKMNSYRYVAFFADDNSDSAIGMLVDLNDGSILSTALLDGGDYAVVSSSTTSAGSGWYRFTMTFTAESSTSMNIGLEIRPDGSNTTIHPSWTAAGTETIYAWGAQLCNGANAGPYLVTTTVARFGIPQGYDIPNETYGVLSEPAGTNSLFNSELFSAWDSVLNVSLSLVSAPDGTNRATRVTNDAVNSDHRLGQFSDFNYTAGANTFSLYAKAGTTNWLQMFAYDGTTFYYANFNLSNGAIGNKQASVTAETLLIGNGWYRCILKTSGLSGGAAANLQIYILEADTASAGPTYAGTSKYFDIWGGQFENSIIATSYIPTGTSSVTRAVDDINITTSTMPSFTTELGMWYYGNIPEKSAPANISIIGYETAAANRNYFNLVSNSTINAFSENSNIVAGTPTSNTPFKASGRWKANDFHAAFNGTLAGTPDTSGTMTSAAANFRVGTGTSVISNWIYRLVVIPRAYTNVELQSKSTL